MHRGQVGLDVANHNLDFGADAVIHLPNAARPRILRVIRRCEEVEADIGRGLTAECKRNLLVHTDGRLRQRQTNMARHTDEDDAEILGKTDGRQGLPRSSGRNIKDQLRSSRLLLENGEQLLLMLEESRILVFQERGVLLNELVCAMNHTGNRRHVICQLDDLVGELCDILIDIRNRAFLQLNRRVECQSVFGCLIYNRLQDGPRQIQDDILEDDFAFGLDGGVHVLEANDIDLLRLFYLN